MSFHPFVHRFSLLGLDVKTTGPTLLATTENAGRRFHPYMVSFVCSAATLVSIPALLGIGIPALYVGVLPASALTGVLAKNNLLNIMLGVSMIDSIGPNVGLYVNVATAATGTSQAIDVHLYGFYI